MGAVVLPSCRSEIIEAESFPVRDSPVCKKSSKSVTTRIPPIADNGLKDA
jgi:hypothetical protein